MAGAGETCVLVILAGLRSDLFTAGFAALFLGALGLHVVGKTTAGNVLLGLLFAEVSARMVPSVVSNAAHGDGGFGAVIPLGLAAISLLGLVATCMSLFHKPWPASRRRHVAVLTGTLMAPVLFLTVVAPGLRPSAHGQPPGLKMSMDKLAFSTTQLDVTAGDVRIGLENDDLTWHTFTIDALGVDVKLPVGGRRDVSFHAPPGTYSYICRVPGHAAMRGTLRVE